MIVPLFVGREKSVRALEDVMEEDKQILLVSQKDASHDDPSTDDIYTLGTIGTILQLLKLPDGTVKVLVEGGARRASRATQRAKSFSKPRRRSSLRTTVRPKPRKPTRWPAPQCPSSSNTSS